MPISQSILQVGYGDLEVKGQHGDTPMCHIYKKNEYVKTQKKLGTGQESIHTDRWSDSYDP